MFQIRTKTGNIKDMFDLYHKTDYFGFDNDYIVRPCDSSITFRFKEQDHLIFVDYNEKIPDGYYETGWNTKSMITLEFQDEETALYYQLKWGE